MGIVEYDFDSVFAEYTAGLCSGVIEFCGLTDDNRTGADDENFLDAFIEGHVFFSE